MTGNSDFIASRQVDALLPPWLQADLRGLLTVFGGPLYLTGGVVRDLVRKQKPADIDCTVIHDARRWAEKLAERTGGAYVPLGRDEDAARVVAHGFCIDFSSYRQGAETLEQELGLRDLSVNALGLRIDSWLGDKSAHPRLALCDPTGGLADIKNRLIRVISAASLRDDPLRLLRVFRFAATLGFTIQAQTLGLVQDLRALICSPAPERIAHELGLIMESGNSYGVVRAMADSGLLWELFPELAAGVDLEQPASHHLDVFGHSLEALRQMERILAAPGCWFPESTNALQQYIDLPAMRRRLCWAALLHDVGKPPTHQLRGEKGNQITFYHHDHVGARLVLELGHRLRWSNEEREYISALIRLHMRPFFLANNAREGRLTLRASIRLLRKVDNLLPGLFLLAMADSLAGKGEKSVVQMEEELSELYQHLAAVERDHVAPIQQASPLVNGHDLITELKLTPGPLFKQILRAVEEAQMEGTLKSRVESLELAQDIARKHQLDQ